MAYEQVLPPFELIGADVVFWPVTEFEAGQIYDVNAHVGKAVVAVKVVLVNVTAGMALLNPNVFHSSIAKSMRSGYWLPTD